MQSNPRSPAAALLLLALLGCAKAPEAFDEVARRLGAEDFGGSATPHAPMLAIGNTAREVIASPERQRLAEVQSAMFGDDGLARMEFAVAGVPPSAAFELEVHGSDAPEPLEPRARALIAGAGRFVRLERGWRLEPIAPGRTRLAIEHRAVAETVTEELVNRQVVARLYARMPIPAHLVSRPFDAPPGATAELAYGILDVAEGAATPDPVALRATLRCGSDTKVLLDTRIDPRQERPQWLVRRAALPAAGASCTVELTQADDAGRPSPFVAWGALRILAPLAQRPLQIVLISLDTLRADHLSGYGYPRATSPEIDRRLIGEGVRFADASTTIGSTGIAHLSLFTGLFPRQQRTPGRLRPADPTTTLTERLRRAGFATGAFTEDGLVAGAFGFRNGFDLFREYHVVSDARGTRVFDDAVTFLRDNQRTRFFLWLHTYKVHDPWEYAETTRTRFADGAGWADGTLDQRVPASHRPLMDDYDRTIVEADAMVARLLDEIDRLGMRERTLVVLLADHGEAFGEHGIFGHGDGPYQEELHIPLVLRGPGVGRGVRHTPVSITDVASTILDLAGDHEPRLGSGRSLASLVRTDATPEMATAAAHPMFFTWLHTDADGVRQGTVKLIRDGASCREYDLAADPLEQDPRAVSCDGSALAQEIARYRHREAGAPAGDTSADDASVPAKVERSLRALGYVE